MIILQHLGYTGSYGFALASTFLAIIYLIIGPKEPLDKKNVESEKKPKNFVEFFAAILNISVLKPMRSMSKLFTGKKLQVIVYILLLTYALYAIAFQVQLNKPN